MTHGRDNVTQITPPVALSVTVRASLCALIATLVALNTWALAATGYQTDFQFYWTAARLWAQGIDPYAMRPRAEFLRLWPLKDPLFYPLPTLMLVGPFAWIAPVQLAQAVFMGAVSGLLAWRLSRDAWWPLLLFLSPSFLVASFLGQWSPWLVLGTLSPALGFLLFAKPTLGLACFLYRPSWRAVVGCAVSGLVSLALMPRWPVAWLDNLRSVDGHLPPIASPWGAVLLLALVRWRDPSARLLLAMACVPQLGFFADQLPLFLVARTKREALLFVGGGLAAFAVYVTRVVTSPDPTWPGPYVALGCYLPALWIVLRRPSPARSGSVGSAWRYWRSRAYTATSRNA
jgi:hypothetical protein